MQNTPNADRLHIAIIGRTNAGKSTIINALCGQQVSLVSNVKGTTTDAVSKAMELFPLGPVLFIDTAGINDASELGKMRIKATNAVLEKSDLVLIALANTTADLQFEQHYIDILNEKKTPYVFVINKFNNDKCVIDLGAKNTVFINALTSVGIDELKQEIITVTKKVEQKRLLSGIVAPYDTVVLVMPQDNQAPVGRLILPQVQTIREALDNSNVVICVSTAQLESCLGNMKTTPSLIITDSKEFKEVYAIVKDTGIPLTSFSILFSREKGDIKQFIEGAKALDTLKDGDNILVMEACTHHVLQGDIARERIPQMIEKALNKKFNFKYFAGSGTIPNCDDISLVIHCGGCMINAKNMLSRIDYFKRRNIPITNFGIVIAHINNILDKVVY